MNSSYGIKLAADGNSAELEMTEDDKKLITKLNLNDLDLLIDAMQDIRDALALREKSPPNA